MYFTRLLSRDKPVGPSALHGEPARPCPAPYTGLPAVLPRRAAALATHAHGSPASRAPVQAPRGAPGPEHHSVAPRHAAPRPRAVVFFVLSLLMWGTFLLTHCTHPGDVRVRSTRQDARAHETS